MGKLMLNIQKKTGDFWVQPGDGRVNTRSGDHNDPWHGKRARYLRA